MSARDLEHIRKRFIQTVATLNDEGGVHDAVDGLVIEPVSSCRP